MDKQKQIEEMAYLMSGCINCRAYDELHPKCQCFIQNELNATKLYNAGYRKIPEGSVVLTEEEFCEFREDSAKVKFLKKEIQKQAVKEFAERLKENFRKNNIESGIWFTNVSIVDETAKEFGVELWENIYLGAKPIPKSKA